MIQQYPLATAVGVPRQQHFERVMSFDADATSPVVPEAGLELGDPLRMRRSTQAESVSEQARPVFARPHVFSAGEIIAPQVFGPFLAVPVMRIAPEPRGQREVLVGARVDSGDALIDFCLCFKQPFERRTGQLAGIPVVIGAHLRIAHAGQRYRTDTRKNDGRDDDPK